MAGVMRRNNIPMTYHPDMSNFTMVASGDYVRAVGWLHPEHPYPRGHACWKFRWRLRRFVRRADESTEELGWGSFRGSHTCEFCGRGSGYRNFGVPAGGILFVAPEMILHYVRWHRYLLPVEFIEAVLSGPLPGTAEYGRAVLCSGGAISRSRGVVAAAM